MEKNLEVTDIEKDIEDAINEAEVVSEEETSTDKVVEEETVDSEDGIEEAKKTVSEEDPEDEEDEEDNSAAEGEQGAERSGEASTTAPVEHGRNARSPKYVHITIHSLLRSVVYICYRIM